MDSSSPVDIIMSNDGHESVFPQPSTILEEAEMNMGSASKGCPSAKDDESMQVIGESFDVNQCLKIEIDDQTANGSAAGDNEPDQQAAKQEVIEEVERLPKLRPKKGVRKSRIKRKKKERASRQISSTDMDMAANFSFMRKRRQDLTLGAKVKVLEMLDQEPKVPQGKIASMFRVSQSQVSRIMKNKEAIMTQWNRFATPERKRCRVGKAGALEQTLLDWYKEARKDDLPISGPILMEKAKSIGVEMGIDFKPSAGWLGRWKDRNGVTLKVFKDKDGTPSITKVANHWRRYMFAKATRDVPWQNVWVVDETVLAYNSVPDFMAHMISGGKDKMTVILACNLSGTERKPAAVVGPVQSLEYLSLPVSYFYDTKSKINVDSFSSWLREWDRELHLQKKKIVLILNKAKHHPENIHFFNISITHFPMDTAKVLQPLQLGIISSFKALYRHQQLKLLLAKTQANEHMIHANMCSHSAMMSSSHSQGVSTLDAVYMIYKAWKHVSPETIAKGAVKAGLSKDVDALKVNDFVSAPPGISQEDFKSFVMKDNDFSVEDQEEIEKVDTNAKAPVGPYNYPNMTSAHVNQTQRNNQQVEPGAHYPNMTSAHVNQTQRNTQQVDRTNQQIEPGGQYLPALPKVPEAVFACQVLRRYLQQQGGRLYDEFSKLESAIQIDMIHESQPDMKNEGGVVDPFHDPSSVHSLDAHKEAECLKVGYLQKLLSALEEKSLQKELKKAAQVPLASALSDNSTSTPSQEIRTDVANQAVDAQRHNLPCHELPRPDIIRQEIQPPVQRPTLIHQEMMRPEYQQDVPVDRSRTALFEMRPVNMSAIYRPVQQGGRNCQSENNKNGTLTSLPTDLRTMPISDPRGGAPTHHHPGHGSELHQNMRQPDARLEHPGLPYYTIHNPLHNCVCGNAECCS